MKKMNMLIIFITTTIHTILLLITTVQSVNDEYHPEERDSLVKLRDSLSSDQINLHSKWTGPPCHKNDTNWFGVVCSNSHVVQIVLQGLKLNGTLSPTTFVNVTFLVKLSLSNNSISGPVPDFTGLTRLEFVSLDDNLFTGSISPEITKLKKLKRVKLQRNQLYGQIPPMNQTSLEVFDVSENGLSGEIPDTVAMRRFPAKFFKGNPKLCGFPLEKKCGGSSKKSPTAVAVPIKSKGMKWWSVAGIAAALGFVPCGILIVWLCYYRHGILSALRGNSTTTTNGNIRDHVVKEIHAGRPMKNGSPKSKNDPEKGVNLEFFDKETPLFDLDDLLRSSAEVLGKGALGTTYKTTLETGQNLAVKRLKDMNEISKKEFVHQMQVLGKISSHENLVKIVSFYYSKEEKLVVYEFVLGGTLFSLLHENRGVGRVPLNWETRVSIIKDIAKGLIFLHQSLPHHKVPHANLKSTNILIQRIDDKNLRSRLTDFGYFPLVNASRRSPDHHSDLAVARSPEHVDGKRLSRRTDVYCFGIIILEIITGRNPGEISPASDDNKAEDLSDWVRTVVNNDWSTDILDAEIIAISEGHDEMLKLTDIALQCTDIVRENRPKMREVLQKIEEIEISQIGGE